MKNPHLHLVLGFFAGWVNRNQLAVIEYLKTENQVYREQLGDKRVRFTDNQRRRLAARAKALGRKALSEMNCIVSSAL
jgi:putative transposase